jgi:hypothetical protein
MAAYTLHGSLHSRCFSHLANRYQNFTDAIVECSSGEIDIARRAACLQRSQEPPLRTNLSANSECVNRARLDLNFSFIFNDLTLQLIGSL